MTEWQTHPNLSELATDLSRFEQALLEFAQQAELDLAAFPADHISLRCHKESTADRWRDGWMACARVLSVKEINGRPIYLFDLPHPIRIGSWLIDCVELPYPGKKYYPHEGWEHIELVIGRSAEEFQQRVVGLLSDKALSQQRLKFSAPQGKGERLPNPTLALSHGDITIKFHPSSIREVIASEQNGMKTDLSR